MKLEEDLKATRYVREKIDLIVNEEGYVILPAWQFALFVREYQEQRTNAIMWLAMFVLVVVWYLMYITMVG